MSQVGIREIREAEKVDVPPEIDQLSNGAPHKQSINGLSLNVNHGESVTTITTQLEPTSSIQYIAAPPPSDEKDQPMNTEFEPTPGLGLLDGIHYYASLSPQTGNNMDAGHGHLMSTEGNCQLQHPDHMGPDPIEHPAAFVEKASSPLRPEPVIIAPQQPPPGPIIEYASRCLVALRNIDSNALNLPELQSSVLLKKRNNKIQSEYCGDTFVPVR